MNWTSLVDNLSVYVLVSVCVGWWCAFTCFTMLFVLCCCRAKSCRPLSYHTFMGRLILLVFTLPSMPCSYTAEEEEKRARERERMKAYQDRIYQENLDDIERKARNKLQSFAEDKYVLICLYYMPSHACRRRRLKAPSTLYPVLCDHTLSVTHRMNS